MTARWYIVHAYSNFEKKVAEDIEAKAKQKGLSELIEQIVVPTEKIVEVRRGRKVDAERKFFPGYVLVRATLTDAVFSLIKNTPKVTGFLGDSKPVPVSQKEVDQILNQFRMASSVQRLRYPSRLAKTFAFPMVRSLRSTASFRKSTKNVRVSRLRFPSSGAQRLWIWNTVRSTSSDRFARKGIHPDRISGGVKWWKGRRLSRSSSFEPLNCPPVQLASVESRNFRH